MYPGTRYHSRPKRRIFQLVSRLKEQFTKLVCTNKAKKKTKLGWLSGDLLFGHSHEDFDIRLNSVDQFKKIKTEPGTGSYIKD